MRIDDLNRTPPTHEADKSGAAQPDRAKLGDASAAGADTDAADISQLAANALDPTLNAKSTGTDEGRLEMLRLQIERGEYHVSTDKIAASIIEQHTISRND